MAENQITVTYDIKELFTGLERNLNTRFDNLETKVDRLEAKVDRLEGKVTSLEIGQAQIRGDIKALDERLSGEIKALDQKLSGEIKTLNEKISGLDKRVGNQEFLNRATVGGLTRQ